ncbi:uncharacterized protein LOC18448183 [Amborella trichopoda]|uniref:DUF4408 domain-containing protein n=1 Tax=Amborella trichopoda TaxID=13333 RepID=U5DH64_AMBTC|nr:uncharacterized protein LOC18448183 [Amborella trichopoda]ERN19788.1 hypothetical protein AMTR_s00064p00123160 [Amborella trichopoda]|eukprot:XP_006858321.1 uncharacterized protein LOC18448183 [Amborella trichopoda]
MLEEGIWASMHGWLTPMVLFLLLNLVIGTIAVSSSLAQKDHNNKKLERRSSVLERLKSINLYRQRTAEVAHLTETFAFNEPLIEERETEPPLLERERVLVAERKRETFVEREREPLVERERVTFVERESEAHDTEDEEHHFVRSKTETQVKGKEPPLKRKMKKSMSVKSTSASFEGPAIVARPASVRVKSTTAEEGSDEVDAKADDFINKFKQQLKLQRLESLVRYKEMINRGK